MIRLAFDRLLNSVPAAFLLLSRTGDVMAANARARELLALPQPAGSLADLVLDDAAAVQSYLDVALAATEPVPGSFAFRMNGRAERLRCDAARVHDEERPDPFVLLRIITAEGAASQHLELNRELDALRQEMEARAKVERALRASQERSAFLAEASRVLASSLDVDTTLRNIAQLAVPTVADWCAVDLLEGDGEVRRVAVEHTDPAKVALAHTLQERYPQDRESPHGLWAVIRTGTTQWMADIPPEVLAAAARDPEHLELIRQLQLRSYVVAPLKARGRVLGALSFVFAESGRRYSEDDVILAEDLARRAAVAIDNAFLLRTTEQARTEIEAQNEELQNLATEMEAQALELEQQLETVQHLNQDLHAARLAAEETEQYVRSILEGISDPLVVHDRDWRFRYINAAGLAVLRSTGQDDLVGKVLWEAYPHLAHSRIGQEMQRAMHERATVTFEVLGELTSRWTEIRCYPLPDGGIASVWKDISERKRADAAAALLADVSRTLASSLDYEATLSALADLLVPAFADWCAVDVLDDEERIQRVATRAASPDDSAPAPPLPRVTAETGVGRVIRTGEIEVSERALTVPLVARERVLGALTLRLADSRRSYTEDDLATARELGSRAGNAIDNARLYRQAQQASRAKTEFLAVMSHELRTPLNAIMGYADLLEGEISGPMNDAQKQQVDRLNRAAQQLLQLIDQILSLSRIEAGKDSLQLEDTDAVTLAREAAALMEPAAQQRALALRVAAPDGRVTLRTDHGRARQILLNLLANAVKFTEHGGIELRVTRGADVVEFDVIDTGVGIAPADLERIFEPFVQVDSTATRRHGGSGLGLAVSRNLARTLGGSLTVRSEPGRGSTFTLTLPLA